VPLSKYFRQIQQSSAAAVKPEPDSVPVQPTAAARPETESLQMSRPEVSRTFSRDDPIQMPEKVCCLFLFAVQQILNKNQTEV
jgi:hypothetical protein